MGFLENGLAANDRNFNLRVQAALVKIAVEIATTEAETVADHTARLRLALAVSQNPSVVGTRFAWLVANHAQVSPTISVSNGVVTVTATDALIETLCENFWTPIATWAR